MTRKAGRHSLHTGTLGEFETQTTESFGNESLGLDSASYEDTKRGYLS